MNALGSDVCSQRSDQKEDKGQRRFSFHVAFAGKHNMNSTSRISLSFVHMSMSFSDEKTMSYFWCQEKSYAMEGDAEARNAGQRAKMLESSYF